MCPSHPVFPWYPCRSDDKSVNDYKITGGAVLHLVRQLRHDHSSCPFPALYHLHAPGDVLYLVPHAYWMLFLPPFSFRCSPCVAGCDAQARLLVRGASQQARSSTPPPTSPRAISPARLPGFPVSSITRLAVYT